MVLWFTKILEKEEWDYSLKRLLMLEISGQRTDIFSFNKQNKVFVIRSSKDLDNWNVSFNNKPIVFPELEV